MKTCWKVLTVAQVTSPGRAFARATSSGTVSSLDALLDTSTGLLVNSRPTGMKLLPGSNPIRIPAGLLIAISLTVAASRV
jgi:hypothetical protein